MVNFVDITQDGAGVIEYSHTEINGLLTGLVATCCVYVFYGEERLALIHDTGQLLISELCDVAKKCGRIKNAYYAINPCEITKAQSDAHRVRRERIKNILKIKKAFQRIEIPDGNIACTTDGKLLIKNKDILATSAGMYQSHNREVRKCINELNNLFSAKNSQSLPVDLQFNVGQYTELPKLLKSKEEMGAIAESKLQQGDEDYLLFLKKARNHGVQV